MKEKKDINQLVDGNQNIETEPSDEEKLKKKPKPQKMMPVTVCVALVIISCLATFVFLSAIYNNRHASEVANEVKKEKDYYTGKYGAIIERLGDLADVDSAVRQRSVKELPDSEELQHKLIDYYLYGLLDDRYAQYYTASEYKEYLSGRTGTKYGIGISTFTEYNDKYDGIYVEKVIEDSPAEEAGLVKGDLIIEVDGKKVTEETYTECFDSIKGEKGTSVVFKVKNVDGTEREVTVIRGEYKNRTVFFEKYKDDVGYIKITAFYDNTDEEFIEAIDELKEQGIKKYVFDVRNNGGGTLGTVVNMINHIVQDGVVITEIDKNNNKKDILDTDPSYFDPQEYKMIVLVNSSTASAAELFSADLRDFGCAKLVGAKTYGKGSMQTTTKLESGAALKITDYMYLPHSGESYEGVGLSPDIEADLSEEQAELLRKEELSLDDDPQIQAALDLLN